MSKKLLSHEEYIELARDLDVDDIAELLAERDELQNEVFTLHPMHNRIFQAESEQAQQRIHELETALANAWSAFNVLSTSSRVEVATAGFVAQSILTDALGHERLRELIRDGNLDGYEQWQKEYRRRISEDSD